jgi:hypothetical protein
MVQFHRCPLPRFTGGKKDSQCLQHRLSHVLKSLFKYLTTQEKYTMTRKTPQSQSPSQGGDVLLTLRINGQCPPQRVAKRILTAPATPVDKDDIATKPIETVSRGFKLLR